MYPYILSEEWRAAVLLLALHRAGAENMRGAEDPGIHRDLHQGVPTQVR